MGYILYLVDENIRFSKSFESMHGYFYQFISNWASEKKLHIRDLQDVLLNTGMKVNVLKLMCV